MSKITIPCLALNQPIGEFYIASIRSDVLNKLCFARPAQIDDEFVSGNQRKLDEKRAKEIAGYLKTENASIPNTIILTANYDEKDSLLVDPDQAWRFEENDSDSSSGQFGSIVIPDDSLKICSIIDGQHRLEAFRYSDEQMELPCSIFLNLPPSLQAYIFSTINFNQRKVDKSLAYQLFGYQLDDSSHMSWSPDMLAVNLSRSFNQAGPFKNKIVLIKGRERKSESEEASGWSISSAAFIEGVLSLLSGNPKKDKYIISKRKVVGFNTRRDVQEDSRYPLRGYYISGNDKAISEILDRYFEAIESIVWEKTPKDNILFRTVGIAAQFSFLKYLLLEKKVTASKELSFFNVLSSLEGIELSGDYFSPRSATKNRVLEALKYKCGFINRDDVDEELKKAVNDAI